ncbi:hypothetical protein, partial [Burkholderia pseudomallei]|uniref:hypothetical protein n=1 Tax=Burkholderia pseudomallei TaxID=28450 RepID=UPI001C83AB61
TSSSSGIVQLKQPRPFSKIEMARRNQAGQCSKRVRWALLAVVMDRFDSHGDVGRPLVFGP